MERTCRTLRFVIRCIGTQSHVIAEELVMRLVSLYNLHPHSCFLYLVSANQYHSGSCWNFLLLFFDKNFVKAMEITNQDMYSVSILETTIFREIISLVRVNFRQTFLSFWSILYFLTLMGGNTCPLLPPIRI